MGRNPKNIYVFLSDDKGLFYRAEQQATGSYTLSKNSQPQPLRYNPSNLLNTMIEFATNRKYNSLSRSINYPLDFDKDGAAILRECYHLGRGIEEKTYLTIIEWNGLSFKYELSYRGKIDYRQKHEDPKSGVFTVSSLDDSAWGVLSQNDSVEYAIECSEQNPKAIKVLVDGITLVNRYTFQTVQANITAFDGNPYHSIPFVLVNEDGDSAGIIAKTQGGEAFGTTAGFVPELKESWFFHTMYAINNVNISGDIMWEWSTNTLPSGGLEIYFVSSTGQRIILFSQLQGGLIVGKTYKVNINFTWNLQADEKIYFVARLSDNAERLFTITPIVTNIFVYTLTVPEPQIVYGLRPLDLLKELVSKATNGRYTINSIFFEENNKSIITSGDAIRGIPNAKIYTSFEDFFMSFDAINFMAMKTVNGQVWIEKAIEVYKNSGVIIDLGDCINMELEPADEYYSNEVVSGSTKQDYRHPSGRLEFNSENKWSLPILSVKKKLDLVSRYRTGCFDIIFLILDYKGSSSKDNNGDKSTYIIQITDELAKAKEDIETFENVTIDDAPLEPLIKSPITNDVITYNKPVIRGIAPAGSTVNIYVDGVLDGTTIADVNGIWNYSIVTALSSFEPDVQTGVHTIQATFTDLAASFTTISIVIDTTFLTETLITYPRQDDSLFNNKPLIKGVAQQGTILDIILDGVIIGTVTADNSCKWQLQSPLITNGDHILTVGTDTCNFNVDTDIPYPLITYVGSELDGFFLINNLPLIKGIAQPGALVTIYLNYITYTALGTAVADINGNWQFQVVPVNYLDPLSGLPVIVAPIQNGLNVISTSLINHTVGINTTGYKLERPPFSSITGVTDNTVFNTRFSPKRMLINHYPELSPMMIKQKQGIIYFQKEDKNANLRTVLDGVVIAENANVHIDELGEPLYLLEWAVFKTKTNSTFAKILYDFNNGGIIKTTYRGQEIFMLPIGSMKMASVNDEVQEWKLLMSPLTTNETLLNLYKNGLTINLMKNSIYHSDYNTLHFVTYGFQQVDKYNFKDLYDEWFNNRNEAWSLNPDYIQKVQKSDTVKDQIITNGLTGITLQVYRCSDARMIDEIPYTVVAGLAPLPDTVQEVIIPVNTYPEDQYFFVLCYQGKNPSSSELGIAYNQRTALNVQKVRFEGTLIAGDIVSISFSRFGLPSALSSFQLIIEDGWVMDDLLAALAVLIDNEILINTTVEVVDGGNGIVVTTLGPITDFNVSVLHPEIINLAISERIHLKTKWPRTILTEASSSIDMPTCFFSTGFKSIIRVEGLVKKFQPDIMSVIADEESGNHELLYSNIEKKRTLRFGTAYGLPDYLYLKQAAALILDTMKVEGVDYVLDKDEKIAPSDDIDGHPLYYYNVNMNLKFNERGKTFVGVESTASHRGVVLVVDGTAFGRPVDTITEIEIDND